MTESLDDVVDVSAQDVGGFIHLDHVTLEVPDLEVARLFYAEGLGLTADPGTIGSDRGRPQVVWFNIGRQQFHIVKRGVQRTPGFLELVLPNLDAVEEQLALVKPLLAGTDFWYDRSTSADQIDDEMLVRDPWGQRFSIRRPTPDSPFAMGISVLNLPCRPGASRDIGYFYKSIFNARVEFMDAEFCTVHAGPGCRLIYVEDPDVSDYQGPYEGCQIGLYVANFSEALQGIESAGVLLTDQDTTELSAVLLSALERHEFRFQDIVLPWPAASVRDSGGSGDTLSGSRAQVYRLHHEIRSLYHTRFMRPLFNRALGGFAY